MSTVWVLIILLGPNQGSGNADTRQEFEVRRECYYAADRINELNITIDHEHYGTRALCVPKSHERSNRL